MPSALAGYSFAAGNYGRKSLRELILPAAEKLDDTMRTAQGCLRATDLAEYRVVLREPVRGTYRGFEIVSFPPPSSGGINVLQILHMLERFDLRGAEVAERAHLLGQAMKLAFADRAHWLGDPDFAQVPRGLLDSGYLDALSARISPDHAQSVTGPGEPPGHHQWRPDELQLEGAWAQSVQERLSALGHSIKANRCGTPQGGVISPLLANIHLHPLPTNLA